MVQREKIVENSDESQYSLTCRDVKKKKLIKIKNLHFLFLEFLEVFPPILL